MIDDMKQTKCQSVVLLQSCTVSGMRHWYSPFQERHVICQGFIFFA